MIYFEIDPSWKIWCRLNRIAELVIDVVLRSTQVGDWKILRLGRSTLYNFIVFVLSFVTLTNTLFGGFLIDVFRNRTKNVILFVIVYYFNFSNGLAPSYNCWEIKNLYMLSFNFFVFFWHLSYCCQSSEKISIISYRYIISENLFTDGCRLSLVKCKRKRNTGF